MNLANFVNSGHSKQHQIHPDFDDIIVSIHSACTVLLVKVSTCFCLDNLFPIRSEISMKKIDPLCLHSTFSEGPGAQLPVLLLRLEVTT